MRVAFVVGHHKKAKGAMSHLGLREWDFYNEVLEHMTDVNVFYHNENISGYTTRIKNTAKKLNQIEFDLVIELHFNAAVSEQANGCETLYYFASKKGREYAKLFSQTVTNHTGIKTRNGGLKALTNRNDRGFASVYYPKAPTILIEPFFGSNKIDCELIKDTRNMATILTQFLKQLEQ